MRLTLGSLLVTIKYTYPRGSTTIYQRAVPTDLRGRYPGATIKQDLKTADPIKVARLVEDLNRKLEAEWTGLRAAPESSPQSLKAHAVEFLRSWGLAPQGGRGAADPGNDPQALELLHDHIDSKRARYAGGDEHLYREADSADYLTPVEIEAGKLLHGVRGDTLTDALNVHLEHNKKRNDLKFTTYARRAFASLVAVTGDKDIKAFTRADARHFIEESLSDGNKTATVRRRLNSFRAVWSAYRRECDRQLPNPFDSLVIPGEGEDKKERVSLTGDELSRLAVACINKDDAPRWILAILTDTGARLAEVVGLALADIVLTAEVPHIVIKPHPWRSLKNKDSARSVPLVGLALWAAQRVIANATEGQRFAFPQYTTATDCKATSASATLSAWIRRLPMEHTPHDLRHTMADRLREVQCPKEIRYAIDGHARQDEGDEYGSTGHGMRVKSEWLGKVALKVSA